MAYILSLTLEYDPEIMCASAVNGNPSQPFQRCGSCGRIWDDWQGFIRDPHARVLGFQAFPGLPDSNLLVFEHCCGSSISVLAKRLRHILPDSLEASSLPDLFGSESCNQLCRFLENINACDRFCVNARDRRLIRMLVSIKAEAL